MDLKQMRRWHNYYYRSGFYGYFLKNTLKVVITIAILIMVFVALEKWVIDLGPLFSGLFQNMSDGWVLLMFLLSESVLGLIPPDLFIIWSAKFDNVWGMVTLLGVISYIGGIGAYYLGYWLRLIPKLNNYVTLKFSDNFKRVKRWGGVFIVIAALFPIPFSIVCTLSGILRFPMTPFLLLSSTRLLRFYAYGLLLFEFINN